MLGLESVNIIVPVEPISFTILGKLNLILSKLQYFYNNSRLKETNLPDTASAHLSESSGPYKITYYCANVKHSPNCTNHTKEECLAENSHLQPPRQDNKRKTGPNRSPEAHFVSASQAYIMGNNLPPLNQFLIINCGATHHMFNTKKMFVYFKETPNIQVSTGDYSSSFWSHSIGMVNILCNGKCLSLKNCLYVPKLNHNLISLLELCQKNMFIKHFNNSFSLETNGTTILKGTILINLMPVNYTSPTTLSTSSPPNIWHSRLGHPGTASSSIFLSSLQTQQSKLVALQRQIWTFKNSMENLHDCKLKKLVSDWGGEFLNHCFSTLANSKCFNHHFSPAEMPQHNGFAEQANQTILEKTRHDLSPYALWKGVPPRIKRLCIFRCREIISISKSHHGWKLGPTGSEGLLLRTDSELVDEAQPEEAEVVDETHSEETAAPCVNHSSTSLAEQSSYPITDQALHCIKVIGP
ncbi:hypothetical protein O181_060264 [Austropuccinia psidii MF-1]|uniref:Retrovirus-related Pol polyprotein from transposon TNT 1-94-like beta-barrel domain-containing protein n=1 Tax=Austropuccinia psidii MF-1 TaxID=1389203 RepID=A0A9Q3EG01_9BASI|nr:hypothetical protein [Austropuccinia psidii MF-1]